MRSIHGSTPADGSWTQRTERGRSGSESGLVPAQTTPSACPSETTEPPAVSTARASSGCSPGPTWIEGSINTVGYPVGYRIRTFEVWLPRLLAIRIWARLACDGRLDPPAVRPRSGEV